MNVRFPSMPRRGSRVAATALVGVFVLPVFAVTPGCVAALPPSSPATTGEPTAEHDCPEPVDPRTIASTERTVAAVRTVDALDVYTARATAAVNGSGSAPDARHGARAALVSQAPLSEAIAAIAISGNGRLVIAADAEGTLALLDTATLEVRAVRTIARDRAQTIHLALDHEGTRALVALLSSENPVPSEVYAWDLVTDALTRLLTSRSELLSPETLALSPDGDALLAIEGVLGETRPRDEVRVLRIDTRTGETTRLPGGSRLVGGVGFSRGLALPYVLELDGGPPIHLDAARGALRVDARPSPGADLGRVVAFRPTGGQVAVIEADQAIALCSPLAGTCSARVRWAEHTPVEVRYGLGGDCLRVLDADGAQAFVDVHTGELVATFAAFGAPFDHVRGACEEALVPEASGRLSSVRLRDPAARTALSAPAVDALGLGDDEPTSLVAASANGETLVLVVDGAVVAYDVPLGASRAVSLVGVPGAVTDLVWSPLGDELFVRREGEVLRASATRLGSTPCAGHDAGMMLADGSMFFGDEACSLYSSLVTNEIEGSVLAATTRDASVVIASGPHGIDHLGADGNIDSLWPETELGCVPGPACKPRAFLAHDGSLAVVRVGRAVRVIELRRHRLLGSLETDAADELALAADRRSLLVAHAHGGLDVVDLRTGARRQVLVDDAVVFEPGAEISHYVVAGPAGAGREALDASRDDMPPVRLFDARTHREVVVLGQDGTALPPAGVIALGDDVFLLGEGAESVLLDARRARTHATRGVVLDAVRLGAAVSVGSSGDLVAAVCRDDELLVSRYTSSGEALRLGNLGGCSRMRRVTIRPDGGAVAVAVGDAAVVVTLGAALGRDAAPLMLRTQTDASGVDWPVAWVLGGSFDAPDAVVEALRVRRAGPLVSAPLDPAGDHALRRAGIHAAYFATPRAPSSRSGRPAGARSEGGGGAR